MKIEKIGEFGLINKIASKTRNSRDVVVGIGDDAAVLKYTKDKYLLLTTDMLVEDVHFKLKSKRAGTGGGLTGFQIGRKALAVNISDIAAMGGLPEYALISAGLPPGLPLKFAEDIYRGINSLARKYNIDIVGGDTVKSEKLVINIALSGAVEKKYLVTRKGAKCGDLIFVTGPLGGSIQAKHFKFEPRVKAARALVKKIKPTSMIDISDGLSSDLTRIIEAGNIGALIYEEQIPVSGAARKKAVDKKIRPVEFALHDGEDFELLFTLPASKIRKIMPVKSIAIASLKLPAGGESAPSLTKLINRPVRCIGRITKAGSGLKILRANNQIELLSVKGHDHFGKR